MANTVTVAAVCPSRENSRAPRLSTALTQLKWPGDLALGHVYATEAVDYFDPELCFYHLLRQHHAATFPALIDNPLMLVLGIDWELSHLM